MSWFNPNKKNPAIVKSERAIEVKIDLKEYQTDAIHDLFSNRKLDERIVIKFNSFDDSLSIRAVNRNDIVGLGVVDLKEVDPNDKN